MFRRHFDSTDGLINLLFLLFGPAVLGLLFAPGQSVRNNFFYENEREGRKMKRMINILTRAFHSPEGGLIGVLILLIGTPALYYLFGDTPTGNVLELSAAVSGIFILMISGLKQENPQIARKRAFAAVIALGGLTGALLAGVSGNTDAAIIFSIAGIVCPPLVFIFSPVLPLVRGKSAKYITDGPLLGKPRIR